MHLPTLQGNLFSSDFQWHFTFDTVQKGNRLLPFKKWTMCCVCLPKATKSTIGSWEKNKNQSRNVSWWKCGENLIKSYIILIKYFEIRRRYQSVCLREKAIALSRWLFEGYIAKITLAAIFVNSILTKLKEKHKHVSCYLKSLLFISLHSIDKLWNHQQWFSDTVSFMLCQIRSTWCKICSFSGYAGNLPELDSL